MIFSDLTNIHTWYSLRRKRFWALLLIALYSLAGFVVTPWLLKRELPGLTQDYLMRTSTIGEVRFNPWLLRLEATDFALLDDSGELLAGFDRTVVDLELRSLFLMALVLREATLINPQINVRRYAFADSNIGRMLNDMAATTAPTEAAEPGASLHLIIDEINIVDGAVQLIDEMQAAPFTTHLEPININITNLNTLPERPGAQQINITTETGSSLSWQGTLQLNPLVSAGRIELAGSPLPLLYRYLKDQLAFQFADCCMDISLDYQVQATPDGGFAASVDNLLMSSRNLAITSLDGADAIFSLPELRISGGKLSWPESVVDIDELLLDKPVLNLWLDQQGALNLTTLLIESDNTVAAETATSADGDAPAEWRVNLDRLLIADAQIYFEDRTLPQPGRIEIPLANVTVQQLSNAPGNRSAFTIAAQVSVDGAINIVGNAMLLPTTEIAAELTTLLPISLVQPWLQQQAYVKVDDGTLEIRGSVNIHPDEQLNVQADIEIARLAISETLGGKQLAGWQSLNFNDSHLQLDAGQLEISEVVLKQPSGTLVIYEDGTNNFAALAKEPAAEATTSEADTTVTAAASDPFTVLIGKTTITAGELLFTDLSLPLPFSAPITDFGGTLSTIASNSSQPATVSLEGKVGAYGHVTVAGDIRVTDPTEQADVQVNFTNINMADLTPYTTQFVGREIDSGKMNLELDYVFAGRKMQGENVLLLTQFKLGKKVPNPKAVNLPLDLAVGLLRDANGEIDLALDVSGDLDDPQFSAGGLIMKAFINVIGKAAAAPFKLLGGLLPDGDKTELSAIVFRAGDATLTPPELEKLKLLADAMPLRPNLILKVPGGYNAAVDIAALQKITVEQRVAALVGEQQDAALNKKTRKALENLAEAEFPDLSPRQLRKEFERTAADTGATYFDELAYMAELRNRLEAAQAIDITQLTALADRRRAAIVDELTASESLNPKQLGILESGEFELSEKGWIEIELGLDVSEVIQ